MIYKKSFNNITIITQKFEKLIPYDMEGVFVPVATSNNHERQKIINQVWMNAYKFYSSIANNIHQDFKDSAVIIPAYFKSLNDSGLEPYVGKAIQPAKDVMLDFGNGTTRTMVAYDDGIFIDPKQMISSLTKYLQQNKIKFIRKRINSFSEVKGRFIINCDPLAADEVNNAIEMLVTREHLIMLKDHNPKDLQYMVLIHFNERVNESAAELKRSFYIGPKYLSNMRPKGAEVLESDFIEGTIGKISNNKEFNILLQEAKDFYGIK